MPLVNKPNLIDTIGRKFQLPAHTAGNPEVYEDITFNDAVVSENDLRNARLELYKERILMALRKEASVRRRVSSDSLIRGEDFSYALERELTKKLRYDEAIRIISKLSSKAKPKPKLTSLLLDAERLITGESLEVIALRIKRELEQYQNRVDSVSGIVNGILFVEERIVSNIISVDDLDNYNGPDWSAIIEEMLDKL